MILNNLDILGVAPNELFKPLIIDFNYKVEASRHSSLFYDIFLIRTTI